MPPEETHAADGTPLRLGRYRLVRLLSTGGMARVYEARREAIEGVQPRVALKVILPEHAQDDAFRQLFITEARVGSLLRHQNLVQVQDFDADQGLFYLVMELVEGVTLRQAIRQARQQKIKRSLAVIAEVGRQVCDGLHHAHSARTLEGSHLQLVHRDLKPSNLMLNPQGVVKLLDFGISKAQISSERAGVVRGTWGYMAPEQAEGAEVGPAADLFGLAVVLYELAALQPLFPEKDPDTIKALLASDEAARRVLATLPGQYAPLGGVLVRALQRDPQARYPSAAAMRYALGELAGSPLVTRDEIIHFQQLVVSADSPERLRPSAASGPGAFAAAAAAALGEDAAGLPLRVGDVHRPAAPPAPAPAPRSAGAVQQLQAILAALFIGAAAGIIGFTAWKVFSQRPLLTAPAAIEAPAPDPVPLPPLSPPPPPVEVEQEIPSTPIQITLPPVVPPPAPTPAPPAVVAVETPEPSVPPPSPVPDPSVPAPEVPPPPADPAGEDAGETGDEAAATPPPVVDMGSLSIGASPRARVLVDGVFVSNSPMFRHPISAGSHVVTLQADTGEQVTFNVVVSVDKDVKRMWSFETNDWIKEDP